MPAVTPVPRVEKPGRANQISPAIPRRAKYSDEHDYRRFPDTRSFEADVAKLLHLMVHSVYSDKDVFLRELVSNAADACEKLRYEAIAAPALLGDDPQPRITITLDPDARQLTIEDNGIGMTQAEMAEALGTIARSGTKAFMEQIAAKRMARAASSSASSALASIPPSWLRTRSMCYRAVLVRMVLACGRRMVWAPTRSGMLIRPRLRRAERASFFISRKMRPTIPGASAWSPRSRRSRAMSRCRSSSRTSPMRSRRRLPMARRFGRGPSPEISEEDYTDFYRTNAGQFDTPH